MGQATFATQQMYTVVGWPGVFECEQVRACYLHTDLWSQSCNVRAVLRCTHLRSSEQNHPEQIAS
jgi:hypothetical protein